MSEISIGYGPLDRIDGPPPVRPRHGLIQAAEAAAQGVRLVSPDDERWLNGVQVHPYPEGPASVWDACRSGSQGAVKDINAQPAQPEFGAITVYLADRCTAYVVGDQAEFRARAAQAMEAIEGAAVEREFLTGEELLNNPHLSDGNGTFPNGDTATSPVNAISLLEGEIAKSGKAGLIHMSPMLVARLETGVVLGTPDGVLRTVNGTVVIPGAGYVWGATPAGHGDPPATGEWVYATGPVDVRRSELFIIPESREEAVDRENNEVVYYVERYYLVDWDTQVQSAVIADRCRTEC